MRVPSADPMRVMRAFGLVFLPLAGLLFVPFACWEGTDFMCLDEDRWEFRNLSGEGATLTPFFVDYQDGSVQPLVVHGFQRGRFSLSAGDSRVLLLETGDYAFAGAAVEFDDGLPRLLLPVAEPGVVTIESRASYPLAPTNVAIASSSWELAAPLLGKFLMVVLAPPLPFALAAALVARRRSRNERLATAHERTSRGDGPH
ncbi:MAG: hypothetical protein HYS27_07610 [Deltaproteobacteria bacterium]|nr:hypothetical protein [Deltaproteobacteria bacterium]